MQQVSPSSPPSVAAITATMRPGYERVLTHEALAFVADLARTFGPRIAELLERRRERRARIEAGEPLDFLSDTAAMRTSDWTAFPVRGDLLDRRVEITGPTDRMSIIGALNSGANIFVADFEHSPDPTWDDLVQGQANLIDAVRRAISYVAPDTRERFTLDHRVAVLFVRPRGLHAVERGVTVDGQPVPAALFDFGLFFFHNAKEQLARGTAPYFYLPRMESHLEARLWNEVFVRAQMALGVPRATIKASCLIETLPAAFEMDEFLWELQEHSCGLTCARKGFLAVKLLIKTCHRRRVHALGGMAARMCSADNPMADRSLHEKVRAEMVREAKAGHDGALVSHPGLVPLAKGIFDAHIPGPNQIAVNAQDLHISREELLGMSWGTRREKRSREHVAQPRVRP
jgi:malate synthase